MSWHINKEGSTVPSTQLLKMKLLLFIILVAATTVPAKLISDGRYSNNENRTEELKEIITETGELKLPPVVSMSDIQNNARCLSAIANKRDTQINVVTAYIGQPELRLTCEPLCIRPTGPPEPEWWFTLKYFSGNPPILANKRNNTILHLGKKILLLMKLSQEHTGKYYCQYDGVYIREYWVYVVKHNIGFNLVKTEEEIFVPDDVEYPDWGITVSYRKYSSPCSAQSYEESLIKNSNVWESRWWHGIIFNARFWKSLKDIITSKSLGLPQKMHLTPPRKTSHIYPIMIINSKDVDRIRGKYSNVSTIDMFVQKDVSFVSDLLPSSFPPEYLTPSYIYEMDCTKETQIPDYGEISFSSDHEILRIFCYGINGSEKVTWTKDGKNYSANSFTKLPEGKYTCWRGDMPISSLVVGKVDSLAVRNFFNFLYKFCFTVALCAFFYMLVSTFVS